MSFKLFLVTICLGLTLAADLYSTQYDDVNLEEILKNDRLYKKYFDCLADKGKCTPDGHWLKGILPDALKTSCSKCSEKQKTGIGKVVKFLRDNKADDFKTLAKRYDPDETLWNKYKASGKIFDMDI